MNRRAMSKLNTLLAAVALSLSLALPGCGSNRSSEPPPLEGANIGGPFTLSDKNGQVVHWRDFDGKYRIVYFGYTFCPDACPLDLSVLMKGFEAFAKDHPSEAARVQPMFITIDPARDTPQRVGEFAAYFSPRLLGLTGTPQQVDQAAKGFAATYSRGPDTPGGYLMDHVRIAYLMGPKGEPIATLPIDQNPQAVAAELVKWVK